MNTLKTYATELYIPVGNEKILTAGPVIKACSFTEAVAALKAMGSTATVIGRQSEEIEVKTTEK